MPRMTIVWLLLILGFPTFAATVLVDPTSFNISPGQKFSLDVDVSNITDLYAFQFDLGFDPGLLSALSVTEGTFLPSGGSTFFLPGTIDNVGGTVTFRRGHSGWRYRRCYGKRYLGDHRVHGVKSGNEQRHAFERAITGLQSQFHRLLYSQR